jgi:hypothetical protein
MPTGKEVATLKLLMKYAIIALINGSVIALTIYILINRYLLGDETYLLVWLGLCAVWVITNYCLGV